MDSLGSGTSLQEVFIQATLVVESQCHTNMNMTWKVAHSPRLTTLGDGRDMWFDARLLPQNNLESKKGGKRTDDRKEHPIRITTLAHIPPFGHDVLLD